MIPRCRPPESALSEIYMIAGPAGSGKTTLGLALAEALAASCLDLDDVTSALVDQFLGAHPEHDEPSALGRLREARYALLAARARERVGIDEVIILVAPFTTEKSSAAGWQAWVDALGVPENTLHLVWLDLPPQVRLERMAARAATRDATVLATAGVSAPLPDPVSPAVAHLSVDARLPVAEQVRFVVQRFGNASARA